MAAQSSETFVAQLKADVEARKGFHQHPWVKKFERGELTREQVRGWVEQQYYVTGHDVHVLLSGLYGKCTDSKIRQHLIENIIEEETGKISGVAAHPELYIRLGEALGSTRDTMLNLEPLPETLALRSYWELMMTTRSFAEGVAAGSAGGEAQIPGAAARFAQVLEKKYGLTHDQSAFWWVHEEADKEHGDAAFHFLASLCKTEEEQRTVRATLKRSLDLVWLFFDGLERAYSGQRQQKAA